MVPGPAPGHHANNRAGIREQRVPPNSVASIRIASLALLLSACAGRPVVQAPLECPEPPPCPACETPVCPVVEPEIIERERVVTRTVEVPAPRPEEALTVIGQTETVLIETADLNLPARIDTGADTSAIHAADILPFERDGEEFVRFTIPAYGDRPARQLERPLLRDRGGYRCIRLWLRLGDIRERIDVRLDERIDPAHPLLIGRDFLIDNALVDVSGRFRTRARLAPLPD